MMQKVKDYLTRNWLLIVAGCIIQTKLVHLAYEQRGYFWFGGEMLVLLAMLAAWEYVKMVIRIILDVYKEQSECTE